MDPCCRAPHRIFSEITMELITMYALGITGGIVVWFVERNEKVSDDVRAVLYFFMFACGLIAGIIVGVSKIRGL